MMKFLHEAPTVFELAAVVLGSAAIMAVIFIAIYERDAQAITVLNTVVGAATGTFFLARGSNQQDGQKPLVPPVSPSARPPVTAPQGPQQGLRMQSPATVTFDSGSSTVTVQPNSDPKDQPKA
jgi:hypothetical protein